MNAKQKFFTASMRWRFVAALNQLPAVLFDHADRGRVSRVGRKVHEGQACAPRFGQESAQTCCCQTLAPAPRHDRIPDMSKTSRREGVGTMLPSQLDTAAKTVVPNPTAKAWKTLHETAVWQLDIAAARVGIIKRCDEAPTV